MLGVVEVGYALLDQQVVTKLTREGSNLISRNSSLQDATTALQDDGDAAGGFQQRFEDDFFRAQEGRDPRHAELSADHPLPASRSLATAAAASKLNTRGSGSFGGAPDYVANNSDTDTRLQVTNVPNNIITVDGGLMYVTEIYTRHVLITPFDRFGVTVPQNLYSIAYF